MLKFDQSGHCRNEGNRLGPSRLLAAGTGSWRKFAGFYPWAFPRGEGSSPQQGWEMALPHSPWAGTHPSTAPHPQGLFTATAKCSLKVLHFNLLLGDEWNVFQMYSSWSLNNMILNCVGPHICWFVFANTIDVFSLFLWFS